MKVSTKLSGAFALLVALFIVLLVYHVRTLRDAVATSYELSDISSRLYLTSAELLGRISELDENASKFWVTRDNGYLTLFHESAERFENALAQLDSPALDDAERNEVAFLVDEWQAFLPVAARLDVLALGTPDSLELAFAQLDRLRFRAQSLSQTSQAVMTDRLARSAETALEAERLSWGAGAIALLLSLLISGVIVRSISYALIRLKSGTHEVAEGNFDYRLGTSRNDEFAEVARDFNRMTQRLGELDRIKRDFVSKISHDLKAPLASIRETNRILDEEVPGPLTSKQRELLSLSSESGNHLHSMIAKLLDLSALESGGLEPNRVTQDLAALILRAVDHARVVAEPRNMEIVTHLPERALLVECDEDLIRQLLNNLLENGIKFSPSGSTLTIHLSYLTARPESVSPTRWAVLEGVEGGGIVILSISDEGPGVPEEDRELVFERFFQAGEGRRVRQRGVGLGLTICREIVRSHGGAIWIEEARGGGSAFRILLPRALQLPAAPGQGRTKGLLRSPGLAMDDRDPIREEAR